MSPAEATDEEAHDPVLAANPSGTDLRAIDREERAIRVELKGSGYRERFELKSRWAAEPLDLLRELRALKPTVVHFSGHGGQGGLSLQGADGRAREISAEALAEAFRASEAPIKLVVFNACYSEPHAEALLAHVDHVVGTGSAIHDETARIFAVGLYGGLGEHESVAAAYRQGKAAIRLEGLPDADRPRHRIRDGVDAGQRLLAAVTEELAALPCPYPGMQPYSADTAAHFYGRDAEVEELLGRLRAGEREIYVIGPSGSGKSSLVAAGVLPRLARGEPGLGTYVIRSMRPGEHPAVRLGELLEAPDPAIAIGALLAHRAPGASVMIVIDQLEELFTLASGDERARFLAAVQALRAEPRCVVVLTLRADFFGALMESPLWTDRRGRISRIEVIPLRGEVLRDAIVRPAADLGVVVEPELIRRLLVDAGSEPGVLPLLQETLVQLWGRRRDQRLTLADYEALGDGERSGLAVALSRRADVTVRALTATQEVIARRILLRLISFGEGRSDTRRQQARSELRAAGDSSADFDVVLERLVADRLLTADEDGDEVLVDLAHEVMITAWSTLAGWSQTRRTDEQHRRELEAAAAGWVKHGRRRGVLDAAEVADAEKWMQTESAREVGWSDEVAELVSTSRKVQTRLRRQWRGLVGGTLAALVVIAVVVTLAVIARRRADEAEASKKDAEASRQVSRRLLALSYQEEGRQLLVDGFPLRALPYLVKARREGEDGPPLRMLFWMASHALPVLPPLEHQGPVWSAAFSPDGTRVVTASNDQTARVWDAATGKALGLPLQHRDVVRSAAFSPDGTRVVTASNDQTARVWDAATGKPLGPPLEHQGVVYSAAFSPDGARVVTASLDNTARMWDAVTGKPLGSPLQHQGRVERATFSPDGTRVVTASWDNTARVWEAATGKPIGPPLEHQISVVSAAFSPDGTRVVTASFDKTARVWDAATGKPIGPPLEHQDFVRSAAFSPDGARVVTASFDRTARVWDAATGKPIGPPLEHQDRVASAVFSPDGTRVVTASTDKTARVWDAATGKPLGPSLEHVAPVWGAAFSPDGTRVVTASDDKTARVWDTAAGKPFGLLLQHRSLVVSAVFSVDGARVVTASNDQTARVWDAITGKPLGPPLQHQGSVLSAAFSPDGTRVVTASNDQTARVWDAATGKPLGPPLQHQHFVVSAAFSPDGTRVITASLDKAARVWDAATGKPLGSPLEHQGDVRSAAFSPDGARVVTASNDQTARVWDAITGKPLGPPLQHQGVVRSAAFSPDGTRVVTASTDKTARVWDAATGKPLGPSLEHQGDVRSAAFSPDGAHVVTASEDRTARVWNAATGKPLGPPLEHQGVVVSAAFSRDGSRVITASEDKTARVWDAATGKPLGPPLEHRGNLRSAAFSADGTRVVTASEDKTARVWDTRLDQRTLAEWSVLAEQSPYVLDEDGVFSRR